MKLFPDSKVYMMCPGNIHTGGPECCHQLVSQLIQFGVEAYIFYVSGNPDNPVHEVYVKYRVPYVLEIEDKPHNVLIMPETVDDSYFKYRRVRKIIWWMSVYNYIANIAKQIMNRTENALAAPMPKLFYFQSDDTTHWIHSEYARRFLELNGIPKKQTCFVSDYASQAFLVRADSIDLDAKENFVAYNPKKGMQTTSLLQMVGGDIDWRPIQNMTPEQVQELLAAAKVYIDFGNHPGKDRIPREAAISGCVVITNLRGSAGNDVDVNIPAEFKFDDVNFEVTAVLDKIRDVFDNFDDNYAAQAAYRARVREDRSRFVRDVAAAFSLKPQAKTFIAIAQGLSDKGKRLADIFFKRGTPADFALDDRFFSGDFAGDKFIKTVQNTNYYSPTNWGGAELMIIPAANAKFLYLEGRLSKFALLNPTDDEIQTITKMFNPAPGDIISINAD